VEGLCLLEILDSISFRPNLVIYVKNQYDEDALRIKDDLSEMEYKGVINEIDHLLEQTSGADGNCLDKDNATYHFQYKPIEKSDILYIWGTAQG
jgi:hypothetical protein